LSGPLFSHSSINPYTWSLPFPTVIICAPGYGASDGFTCTPCGTGTYSAGGPAASTPCQACGAYAAANTNNSACVCQQGLFSWTAEFGCTCEVAAARGEGTRKRLDCFESRSSLLEVKNISTHNHLCQQRAIRGFGQERIMPSSLPCLCPNSNHAPPSSSLPAPCRHSSTPPPSPHAQLHALRRHRQIWAHAIPMRRRLCGHAPRH
jgi:hypothetical protein